MEKKGEEIHTEVVDMQSMEPQRATTTGACCCTGA